MNKLDFLRRLDRELSALDQTERRELLAFYEERFYTGTIYENKTEEEVIAELESPEVIARNILSEYGISNKQVRTEREHRNNDFETTTQRPSTGIQTGQLVWLLIIDVLVLSWALPSLFSIVTSMVGSLFTYIGVLAFLNGGTTYDIMIFWFLTGAYVLLFLFTLVILEFFIWAVKRTILWHLRVLRYKKINDLNKKFSKISVEKWFKKHRFLRFVKNISGLAAIIVMGYTGFYLAASYDEIKELYVDQEYTTSVDTIDVSEYISGGLTYDIITEIDSMDVTIIKTTGTDLVITREFKENSDVTYSLENQTGQLTITQDVPNQIFNYSISIEDIISYFNRDTLVIEVPEGLLTEYLDINVTDGDVNIYDMESLYLEFHGSNGSVYLSNIDVTEFVIATTTNGNITMINSSGEGIADLSTTNGDVVIRNMVFDAYELTSTNGSIKAENLNVEDKLGDTFDAYTTNGSVVLDEVYCHTVELGTTNGSISYFNDDTTFEVILTKHTTNGSIETNVD